jgi:glucose-6-phosphate 1-dehydrogenase
VGSETFANIRSGIGNAIRLAHCFAIPPAFFAVVVRQLDGSGRRLGTRIIVEKPFRGDQKSTRELNCNLLPVFSESDIYNLAIWSRLYVVMASLCAMMRLSSGDLCVVTVGDQVVEMDGVPFYLRTGITPPTTCVEIVARFRVPPSTNLTELRN